MLAKYVRFPLPTRTSEFRVFQLTFFLIDLGEKIIANIYFFFCISGCWTNALQPLWIAGKVMSHHSEHAAIVEILIRIERETGWATAWRVEDLKEFWGEYDDDYDIEMN